ncbi:glutamate--cysteine ligase [Mycoemilia scoparia]|uniref:Glutamate--cysteine ligase n=1 Tax=Mycoemilia scoparia TaxID=417184 RepID=A0A9W8DU57_9FUNG|nr:glutamate--cysteine ligase [Mycoemilia scoparia]
MGLLSLGTPLQWEEAKKYAEHVRKNGIEQFISIWRQTKDSSAEPFVWGDELEYIVVKFNPKDQTAHISLDAAKSIKVLQQEEMDALANDDNRQVYKSNAHMHEVWRDPGAVLN